MTQPEPGAIYRNKRSGREWEVAWKNSWGALVEAPDAWCLYPMPDDEGMVRMSGIDEDGKTHGGLVPLHRTAEQLNGPNWEFVRMAGEGAKLK